MRPVDVQFDQCGRLLVTDDGTQSIFTITYDGISFPAPMAVGGDGVVIDNSTETTIESNTTEKVDNSTLIGGGDDSNPQVMDNNSMSATVDFELDATDSSTFVPDEGDAATAENLEGRFSSSAAATTSDGTLLRVLAAIFGGVALHAGW